MKLKLMFFGALRDQFNETEIDVQDGATVLDLLVALKQLRPSAEKLLSASRVAVKDDIVEKNMVLSEGCEVFFLPPASGG